MNQNTQTYDKLVKVSDKGKQRTKKIFAVIGYALFFSVWLIFAFNNRDIFVPLVAAGILCTVLLMLISWKYLDCFIYLHLIFNTLFDVVEKRL